MDFGSHLGTKHHTKIINHFESPKSLKCVRRHDGSTIFKVPSLGQSLKFLPKSTKTITLLNNLWTSHKISPESHLGPILAQLGANLAQLGPKLDPQDPPSWFNLVPSWTHDGSMLRLEPLPNKLRKKYQKNTLKQFF